MTREEFRAKVHSTHGMKAVETDRLVQRRERPQPKKGKRKPPKTVKRLPHAEEMKRRRETYRAYQKRTYG